MMNTCKTLSLLSVVAALALSPVLAEASSSTNAPQAIHHTSALKTTADAQASKALKTPATSKIHNTETAALMLFAVLI